MERVFATLSQTAWAWSTLLSPQARNSWFHLDLPAFKNNGLFVPRAASHKGITCFWSPAGVVVEAHFDFKPNFFGVLQGQRRYIIAPPSTHPLFQTYPEKHPSERHSAIDLSDPNTLLRLEELAQANVVETVLRPGEVLFVPPRWMHYIISLTASVQCAIRF